MKTLILTATAFALAIPLHTPAFAGVATDGWNVMEFAGDNMVDRRKRRVPGGSGCDDPGDVLEHPECR